MIFVTQSRTASFNSTKEKKRLLRSYGDYMLGLAKVKGTVKILLALDRVLGADGQFSHRVF